MRNRSERFSLGLLAVVVAALSAACSATHAGPNLPFVDKDVCPFECCQFGPWVAGSPLVAYQQEGSQATIAFTIQPGRAFVAHRGNVHVKQAGIVVVTVAGDGFATSDTLYVLGYHGEGEYPVWHRGTVRNVGQFWDNPEPSSAAGLQGRMTQEVRWIWWVSVTDDHGRSGWLRLVNQRPEGFELIEAIDGMDGCG
jgi:hypothetical protein